ncbi:hypothetical protein QQG55_35795 [Brugia pahangi]
MRHRLIPPYHRLVLKLFHQLLLLIIQQYVHTMIAFKSFLNLQNVVIRLIAAIFDEFEFRVRIFDRKIPDPTTNDRSVINFQKQKTKEFPLQNDNEIPILENPVVVLIPKTMNKRKSLSASWLIEEKKSKILNYFFKLFKK